MIYLNNIVLDALEHGHKMKNRISDAIEKAGFRATEERIRKIVYWNRLEQREHEVEEIQLYLL